MYKIKVKSRHDSHKVIRDNLPLLPFLGVVRFGSVTEVPGALAECNTIIAVQTAMDKRKMKRKFDDLNVIHAAWRETPDDFLDNPLKYPVVIKNPLGSGGTGVYLIKDKEQFDSWRAKPNHQHDNYIFEAFHDYGHEFRLNCTQDECFLATRKVLKPGEVKNVWKKGGDNCVWLGEDNPKFEKPANWDDIVKGACLAVRACGLDIGGVDVKVQKNYDKNGKFREAPEWFVIECNSAPSSHGNKTQKAYIEAIVEILKKKHGDLA